MNGKDVLLIGFRPDRAARVRALLTRAGDVSRVESAGGPESAEERLADGEIGVVVLDLDSLAPPEVERLARVARRAPTTVVGLGGDGDVASVRAAYRCGTVDCLGWDELSEERLLTALRVGVAGDGHTPMGGRGTTGAVTDAEGGNDRYRLLFEGSRDALYVGTRDGRMLDVNPAFLELFGYERSDLGHLDTCDLYADASERERFQRDIEVAGSVRDYELRLRHKDGRPLDCLVTATVRRAEDGTVVGYEGIIRDITERKQLELQLRLSQRLEAIGRLAGGVAHDFNNMLMAITGSCELLRQDLHPGHPGLRELEEIRRASSRAAELTRQLLAFSRRQVLQPKLLDVNEVVRTTEKMLRRLIGEDIELVTRLEPTGHVMADPTQLEQVIMNLAVNARDAMPDGGVLTIETRDVELDREYALRRRPTQPGRYVQLAVSDNGIGMTEESRAHIFEPFYTTKSLGEGTGLGLSTVYGIVKQSGGYIWAYSEPGEGSTFKIYLPRANGKVGPGDGAASAEDPVGGSETVLVVEDEKAVRGLVCEFLQRYGYTVLEGDDWREALELCRRHEGPIDLLVTDVVMPLMNGPELAERVRRIRPAARVLYISGYTDETVIRRGVENAEVTFLQKPFTPKALAHQVRRVLDAEPSQDLV